MVLSINHDVFECLPGGILLQLLHFLIHLLKHFHEHLCTHLNFFHGIDLFSDVVAFVAAEKRTCMAHHLSARQADELLGLVMRTTKLHNVLGWLYFDRQLFGLLTLFAGLEWKFVTLLHERLFEAH